MRVKAITQLYNRMVQKYSQNDVQNGINNKIVIYLDFINLMNISKNKKCELKSKSIFFSPNDFIFGIYFFDLHVIFNFVLITDRYPDKI